MLACPNNQQNACSTAERDQQVLANAVKQVMEAANAHHKAGRLVEAEELYRRILVNNPRHPGALINMALIARDKGLADIALSLAGRALESAPRVAQIHFLTGEILSGQGKATASAQSYQQALLLNPEHAPAHHGLGILLHAQERHDQACKHIEEAIRLRPNWGAALNNLGTVYRALRRNKEAIPCYMRALECGATQGEVYRNLGDALNGEFRYQEALAAYEQALRLLPGDPEILGGMALVLEKNGKIEEAYELIRPVIEQGGYGFNLVVSYVKLSSVLGHQERCSEILERLIARRVGTSQEQMSFHLHLAHLYDSLGRYDEAFRAFRAFNDQKRGNFNRADYQKAQDLLVSSLNPDDYRKCHSSGSAEETPLFIIGMPRSGTSLVEQILASHSEVHGAGELQHMIEIGVTIASQAGFFVYGPAMPALNKRDIAGWADRYMEKMIRLAPGARRITDKMPYNFFYAGLIHLLFPKARIIHCVRNPIDTCLSSYFRDFRGNHPYTYDLEDLAVYYKGYERIMAHWRDALQIPMLEVHYEEMVTDQEGTSRKIIEYCGLDWEPSCLDFHRSGRDVKTASYQQVRRPIYTTSVERWRRYEKHIDILLKAFPQQDDRSNGGRSSAV
jgi:tetratricopeptide (TPR) repeat protein